MRCELAGSKRRLSDALTAGWLRNSRAAARDTERSRISASKVRSMPMSRLRMSRGTSRRQIPSIKKEERFLLLIDGGWTPASGCRVKPGMTDSAAQSLLKEIRP